MLQAKTEVALQFSECCAAEVALQHSLFCSAEVIFTKCCAAASEKLQCNIPKAALQESGAFLPLWNSCGSQAPTFRPPRFGPAEFSARTPTRKQFPHSTVYECFKAFFDTLAFLKRTDTLSTNVLASGCPAELGRWKILEFFTFFEFSSDL